MRASLDEPITQYLVKFFSKEKYADQFMQGHLHFNRLSFFKGLESGLLDGRADPNEAVGMWWQPHDFEMDLNLPGVGATKITKADLAGPVSMSFDAHNHLHVFCLYAMYARGYRAIGDKLDIALTDIDDLKRQFAVDERCFAFGPHAVVTAVAPFIAQLKAALAGSGRWFKGGLIHYYDDATFHGEIPLKDIPFWKQSRFSYQKEFRICINTGTEGQDPMTFAMGNISSFSRKLESSNLNSLFQVKVEAA